MELVYNLDEIRSIFVDFHNLTKFRIALFDENFSELLSYPNRLSTYCKILRSNALLNSACNACDYNAFSKCRHTRSPVTYECHAGLTEIIIPVISDNTIIGYIMSGQLRKEETNFNWEYILSSLCDYDLDYELLKGAYEHRPQLKFEIIESATRILGICANYLSQCNKIAPEKNTLAYKIDTYILENIAEDFDVMTLCSHFKYKKTHFYKLTNELYGIPIMKRIRQIRMHQAKLMLSQTRVPISEIAAAVGIYDYNYFTKIFKSEVKCTPREFRANSFSSLKSNDKLL